MGRPPVEPELAIEGGFRAGYVALIGRPNVGKSTLLNHLLGTKLAATTHKPQTTRKNLLGILMPKGAQLLLLDTPGYHQAKGPLNRYMVDQARQAIEEADAIGYVIEARGDGNITPGNVRILEALQSSDKPVVLLPNKIDRVKDKQGLLLQLQAYSEALGERMRAAVPISARKGAGLTEAVLELARALPEGPALFEGDTLTDSPEQAVAAEFVREKVMLATQDELPYSAAVTIDQFQDARPKIVRIIATIHVERASQKPIVIGRQGERVKQIGTSARRDLELFLQSKVYLELHVRVTEEWSSRPRGLVELGYGQEGAS
ncbi:MAG: GTPase Era [Myxococcota bacterium]